MEVSYYNLSGGINLSVSKTELGLDTKKIYWADAENIEIFINRGITRQKGNALYLELPEKEEITGLAEMASYDNTKLVITTYSGKIYIYDEKTANTTLLEKTLLGKKPRFVNFLNGIVVVSEKDPLFYIKDDANFNYEVTECGLKDSSENLVTDAVISVFRGRVWVAKNSVIYYSALGTYDDFTTADDAGYIKDFHTDTDSVTALKPYKDYLAIYKTNKVYLLSGITPEDFQITAFADKGALSSEAIINVSNKQYFLSNNGIFALEESGELNQIVLGSEITANIKSIFNDLTDSFLSDAFCIHYEKKSQVWYFLPNPDESYLHTVWINDYINKAWYKRVIPQNITCAASFKKGIITADNEGNLYLEDVGNTFNDEPIVFKWKSPFLSITNANHRKIIDEFYFLLDSEYDNDFYFSVYKDFDSECPDDREHISTFHREHFIWGDDREDYITNNIWPDDDDNIPVWSINKDVMEKAEISESNYSVQLCIDGADLTNSCTVIGLYFKEIYKDD